MSNSIKANYRKVAVFVCAHGIYKIFEKLRSMFVYFSERVYGEQVITLFDFPTFPTENAHISVRLYACACVYMRLDQLTALLHFLASIC